MQGQIVEKQQGLMDQWREFRELLWINLKVKTKNLRDYLHVIYRYYRDVSFLKTDLLLLSTYITKSPFAISRQYLQEQGETEVYTYGETPLGTLDKILQQTGISKTDHYLEAGCGRGRGCFWVNHAYGIPATGIDVVPTFIQKANWVKGVSNRHEVTFLEQDMLEADYSKATVIYLYGICFDTPFIQSFVDRMEEMPSGTKIITVSYPLSDYTKKPLFEVMRVFPAKFTWGKADVYVQYRL